MTSSIIYLEIPDEILNNIEQNRFQNQMNFFSILKTITTSEFS